MTCYCEVPGKWDIQRVARGIKGCSAFNDVDFKCIRGRIEYDRMTKRAAEVVAAFPRLRPSNDEIVRYVQEKEWYSKDTLHTVTKTWVPLAGTQSSSPKKDRLENCLREKIEHRNGAAVS
ncbi:hypothetical protein ACJMK2_005855 [Sinanodonta woodiana]|uniref:Uncharacterized protein n=1 Tax=Sinanodonta woodiana TaxID=1069815 RepID=A0ABD3VRD3_SINWO